MTELIFSICFVINQNVSVIRYKQPNTKYIDKIFIENEIGTCRYVFHIINLIYLGNT